MTGGNEKLLERPVFIVGGAAFREHFVVRDVGVFAHLQHTRRRSSLVDSKVLNPCAPGLPGSNPIVLTPCRQLTKLPAIFDKLHSFNFRVRRGRAPSGSGTVLGKDAKKFIAYFFPAQVFPDARFIFLWRDPRENLSSIMEAWRSGNWITYSALPGWDGPWSLLLPPGWPSLRSASLETIAARQWQSANEIALDDLALLPASTGLQLPITTSSPIPLQPCGACAISLVWRLTQCLQEENRAFFAAVAFHSHAAGAG